MARSHKLIILVTSLALYCFCSKTFSRDLKQFARKKTFETCEQREGTYCELKESLRQNDIIDYDFFRQTYYEKAHQSESFLPGETGEKLFLSDQRNHPLENGRRHLLLP